MSGNGKELDKAPRSISTKKVRTSFAPVIDATAQELKTMYGLSSNKKRPPKLQKKSSYIRRLFTTRPKSLLDDPNVSLSSLYNESLNSSYFDQCFEPILKLGEGSFGEVYKVRSKEDGRYYAIKKSKACFRSQADREQKIAEVRKYEKIPKHTNCVALHHAWEQDDHIYIQMELGCTSLDMYADYNPNISESRLWNILLDMLLALQNLHDNNLVHLDIKLENIIICDDGSCKLCDFGLMIDLKGDLKNAMEGDAKYLACEVMQGKFTKAADVFSLGISMLELATDIPLPSNGQLWHDLRDGIFPQDVRDRVPKQLFNFIQRMMIKDYKKRASVKTLLKHPKIKSLLKERREASERGVQLEGRVTPIMRTSTPIPTIGTPTNVSDENNSLNAIHTPPLGYNAASSSLFSDFEKSLESHYDSATATTTSMEIEVELSNSNTSLTASADSYPWSSKLHTPMPLTPISYEQARISGFLPIQTSAKKLDFLDID